MIIEKYRRPVFFYTVSTATAWGFWFIAAYLSHQTPAREAYIWSQSALGFAGLVSPMVVAFYFTFRDPELRADLLSRFFNFRYIRPVWLLFACLLMLASILLAQAVSDVLPFFREIIRQNGAGMFPFVDFVVVPNGLRQLVDPHVPLCPFI